MSNAKPNTIKELLAIKHHKDIFISECKDGSSMGGHFRLDGWAMKRSWGNPLTVGYEIKVSRSDYLGDKKWHNYLKYCNEFYFVCPSGLIKPEEVGDQAGLMWRSKTGNKIYTKKKAPYRTEGIELENVYKYILLWRAKIGRRRFSLEIDPYTKRGKEYWEQWLAEEDEEKRLGRNVSKKIRELVDKRITVVECENRKLQRKITRLQNIKDILEKMGFDNIPASWRFEKRTREFSNIIPKNFRITLENAQRNIEELLEKVESKVE